VIQSIGTKAHIFYFGGLGTTRHKFKLLIKIMNSEINNKNNEEIELIDIWRFLQRQFIFMVVIASSLIAITLVFGVTRPTVWQSHVSLIVGEKYLFQQQFQQQLQQQLQIESFEEIKYKYSKHTDIWQIKNTRIIEISSIAGSREKSLENINATVNEILKSHKQLAEDKRAELAGILHSFGADKSPSIDAIRLIDGASSATKTRQLGEVSIVEKPYGGMLQKTVGLGIILSIFIALVLALARDFVARKSLAR